MRITSMSVVAGSISWFGGPNDSGVKPEEGLAIVTPELAKTRRYRHLFLPFLDTSHGLARQLNPERLYCAMRWTDAQRRQIRECGGFVVVTALDGSRVCLEPVDYGPGLQTKRVIDVSPAAMTILGVQTDAFVNAEFFCRA